MYNETLKKIINDFVNICGENFSENAAESEVKLIDKQIKKIEEQSKHTNGDKLDLDVLNARKDSWLNSASYLGNKIITAYDNNEDKEELLEAFNLLFSKVEKSKEELNNILLENNSDNIIDVISKLNISYIKNKAAITTADTKNYSNIYEHNKQKRKLLQNVIKTLEEKKIIVDEIVELYQNIIKNISDEVEKNNDDLLAFNEKKHIMAYSLLPDKEYRIIEEEIIKLRKIKKLNEDELRKFNEELETVLKEKETIQKEYNLKSHELDELEIEIKEYKIKTENKEYISNEKTIDHNLELVIEDLKINKLNIQKDLLFLDVDKMRNMAIDILSKSSTKDDISYELDGEYTTEEIEEIKSLMEKYNISKKDAIEAVELVKSQDAKEKMVESYMDEFDFSEEEATEALKNDTGTKFWNIDDEAY